MACQHGIPVTNGPMDQFMLCSQAWLLISWAAFVWSLGYHNSVTLGKCSRRNVVTGHPVYFLGGIGLTNVLLTASAVGEMLSLSKRQIFRLNSSGRIPLPVHVGGAVRWRHTDIEEWIAQGCPDRRVFAARSER